VHSAQGQPEQDSAHLLARVRTGEEAAMGMLYDRYSNVVYAVALRVLGDTAAAEDVLQDIFMQLWRNPAAFDSSRGNIAAWLAVVARHRAIDRLRKRRSETDIEDVVLASQASLEAEVDRRMFVAKVRSALANLPPEQKLALEMAFFEGLTHSEIAEKTHEPLGTIKTRIRAAIIALRKALGGTPA
jgi:RNA polymerase sigma-70 factor, ECF subfamily